MFKSYYLLILCLFIGHNVLANNTDESIMPCATIVVTSQADIDNLDLTGCTSIMGDLEISSLVLGDSITDISVFSNIISVSGNLVISGNPKLESLNGLNQLTSVGGQLIISDNSDLKNIDDLMLLDRVEEDFVLTSNRSLKATGSLLQMKYIGDTFNISQNDSLLSLINMPLLDTILGQLIIEQNAQLSSMVGYQALSYMSGLSIVQNPLLVSITGFGNVLANSGIIFINNNLLLGNINAFQNLENQAGDITITFNAAMTSIIGFIEIDKVEGRLYINDNLNLSTISAFASLDSITTDCRMALGNVSDFSALSEIDYVGGSYTIRENAALVNTDFLINLLVVDFLEIDNNPVLVTISEPNTNPLTINGIDIKDNGALESITAFSQIQHVEDLYFASNSVLDSISGFNSLETLTTLNIEDEQSIQVIGGFANLETLDDAYITGTSRLKSISGFNKVGLTIQNLSITYNDSLEIISGFQNALDIDDLEIEDNALLTNLIGFYKLINCSVLDIRNNDSFGEFCPFYELARYDNDSNTDITINGNDDNPSRSDIVENGDCFHFNIGENLYSTLAAASVASMSGDTIFSKGGVVIEFEDILIPTGVVLFMNEISEFEFEGNFTLNGDLINYSITRFDNTFISTGSIINETDWELTFSGSTTFIGPVENKGELTVD